MVHCLDNKASNTGQCDTLYGCYTQHTREQSHQIESGRASHACACSTKNLLQFPCGSANYDTKDNSTERIYLELQDGYDDFDVKRHLCPGG